MITKKDGNYKVRIVAKCFQEDLELEVDSPTITKTALRTLLAIVALKKWHCNSTDIKSAFLQSIERSTYLIIPPPEFQNENKIWKLNKQVYGFNDAPRQWYFHVKEVLLSSGFVQSKYDPALFCYYHENMLQGLCAIHVDDFIHTGTDIFEKVILNVFQSSFKIGKSFTNSFTYIG